MVGRGGWTSAICFHELALGSYDAATQSQSEHGAAHIYPYKQTQITHDTDNTHTTQRDIQRGHVETSLKPYRKGRKRGGFKSLICLQTKRRKTNRQVMRLVSPDPMAVLV